MRLGGLIVIVGGVLALVAFFCLPYAAHDHVALSGADIAIALTDAARRHWPWHGHTGAEPLLVAWWWLWWLVPALALIALGLGITMLVTGPNTDKAHRRLYAAGAVETGLIGAIVLVWLSVLLYAPALLRNGSTCLPCDAAAALNQARRLAGTGFWTTLTAWIVIGIGGVLALIWVVMERPAPPPPKRRIRRPEVKTWSAHERPVVKTWLAHARSPRKEKPRATAAKDPQPKHGQTPPSVTTETKETRETTVTKEAKETKESKETKTESPGRTSSAPQDQIAGDAEASKGRLRYRRSRRGSGLAPWPLRKRAPAGQSPGDPSCHIDQHQRHKGDDEAHRTREAPSDGHERDAEDERADSDRDPPLS